MVDPWREAGVPHVVIVGVEFAGLYAARVLRRARVQVTVLDRRNHHVFQPLFYQVAAAALSPGDIAYPIRAVLARQANTRVWMAEVTAVDLTAHRVVLSDGERGYDFLILAAGVRHAYHGHDEWEELAPGLKSLEDAFAIRRRIISAFELAERETDEQRRRELMRFAVVVGGPTGVELSRVRFSDYFAWLVWLLVQIFWLIGFRNRFVVLFEWAWAYLTCQRAVRLITGEPAAR